MDTKILDKIRKLMSLGENPGATEAERENAMARAQEIMMRHNLSAAQISFDNNDKVNIIRETVKTGKFKWKVSLFQGICEANLVRLYMTKTPGAYFFDACILIGRPDHVSTVKELFNNLVPYLEMEADIQSRNVRDPRNWKNNFFRAASSRIGQRLRELNNKIIDEANAFALVKHEWAAIDENDPFKDNSGKSAKANFKYDRAAWQRGHDAGSNANLKQSKKLDIGLRGLPSGN